MYNFQCPVGLPEGYLDRNPPSLQDVSNPLSTSTNKYVYVKQKFFNPGHMELKPAAPKVLVNPHFNRKIFVNPNFNTEPLPASCAPKIHLNPNVQKINLTVGSKDSTSVKKIHINPTVLKNVSVASTRVESKTTHLPLASRNIGHTSGYINVVPSTDNKLEVSSHIVIMNVNTIRKRRSSLRSKFKIIKSSYSRNPKEDSSQENRRLTVKSKYKLIKSNCCTSPRCPTKATNKFKVDNRSQAITLQKNKKYIYVNRLLSISEIARNKLLKNKSKAKKSSLVNVGGILYKRSPNCLRRASIVNKIDVSKRPEANVSKSKFKLVKKSSSKTNLMGKGHAKLSKSPKLKKTVSPGKLRVCNIPCPYYRKFGRCKGKDSGKCYRKHDPDQIALCTKFLQGACIDKKCLLSHNVSPEKMPTCKFYLEGSCSRDDCPYLHVRISPKADICKDFLVGFCKKASECDKRHQFLCPDYEKNGSCPKPRCQYPHGQTVRKYSVFSKNRFAKKSSESGSKISKKGEALIGSGEVATKNLEAKSSEASVKNRYYVECNFDAEADCCKAVDGDKQNSVDSTSHDQDSGARSRPKLGKLPSFIALEDV